MKNNPKIVIYGAGAIGITFAVWLTKAGLDVSLLARGENAKRLRQKPVSVTLQGSDEVASEQLSVIEKLSDVEGVDIVIITVKNFSLDEVCQSIKADIGDRALIIGLQNGAANQAILPKYFTKVICGVVQYNAWSENTWDWYYNANGATILGVLDPQVEDQAQAAASLISRGASCEFEPLFQDMMHGKVVGNLVNSVTTLIGNSHKDPAGIIPLQKILTNIAREGILTLKAAGYKESVHSVMPPWWQIIASPYIPYWVTRPIFRNKIKQVGSTSMAEDILVKGTGRSELDTINGYLIELADKHSVHVPYSRKVFSLCQQRFPSQPFEALSSAELWRLLEESAASEAA